MNQIVVQTGYGRDKVDSITTNENSRRPLRRFFRVESQFMSLQLHVVAGPDMGRVFTVQPGPDLMLGRSDKSFYRLSDPRVSRSHCQIALEGERAIIICHGGSGGTKVNGKAIQQQPLELGDIIQIGDTQLRLLMGDFPLNEALGAVRAAGPAPAVEPPAGSLEALRLMAGKSISHYEIGHIIGEGDNGITFFANDTKNNTPVALKVLRPEFSKDDEDMQRFIRAIKTVLPLRHPNLISLLAAGKTGPYCWVAMEYVAGETMSEVIKRIGVAGMLDWKYAFKVAVHVGRALEYAHGQSIIHRNVTPNNILLQTTDKIVKLGDLMLAKALEGSLAQPITRPGELLGAVEYMSPERTRGTTDVDHRSDLYGLGATIYALLTGRPPFEGSTLIEKITKIRQHEPVKPTKFQMSIPSGFEGVVLKLLAKRPEDRYQTATDMLRELERVGRYNGATA
jgi:pSer/pThr/pTyr-binding forkhead associated (FHA) protein